MVLTLDDVNILRNDFGAWAAEYATFAAGKLTETGSSQYQLRYVAQDAAIVAGPVREQVEFAADTGNYGLLATLESPDHYSAWNLTTGATVHESMWNYNHAATAGGIGWICRFDTNTSGQWPEVGLSNAAGAVSYAGAGLSIGVANHRQIQCRVSGWTDSVAGYVMANATAATQPFAQDIAGTRPGGNTFIGESCVWQPLDTAKTLSCATVALRNFISGMPSHCWIIRGKATTTPTAAVPWIGITGTGTYTIGFDTNKKFTVTAGSTPLTGTTTIGMTDAFWVFSWDAKDAKGTLYSVTVTGGVPTVTTEVAATAMTVGTITPDSIVFTERCSATQHRRLYAHALAAADVGRICAAIVGGDVSLTAGSSSSGVRPGLIPGGHRYRAVAVWNADA
jgi:hypothetical protein